MRVRLALFVSSYAPLFLIAGIRFEGALRWWSFALAAVGVVAFVAVVRRHANLTPAPLRVATATDEGGQVAGYLATYVLPFVTVSEPSGRDITAYIVFLALLAVVHVNTDLVQVNPLMYAFRYRVVRAEFTPPLTAYLIVKRAIPARGDVVDAVPLSPGVRLAVAVHPADEAAGMEPGR